MPVIIYSVLRLGLFALALLGLWAAGMGGWLLVVVAAVAAGALSYVLLGRQRTAAAIWIAERRAATRPRFSPGVQADAAAEDAESQQQSGDLGQSASPRPSSTP
jgi:hypothetical protein